VLLIIDYADTHPSATVLLWYENKNKNKNKGNHNLPGNYDYKKVEYDDLSANDKGAANVAALIVRNTTSVIAVPEPNSLVLFSSFLLLVFRRKFH